MKETLKMMHDNGAKNIETYTCRIGYGIKFTYGGRLYKLKVMNDIYHLVGYEDFFSVNDVFDFLDTQHLNSEIPLNKNLILRDASKIKHEGGTGLFNFNFCVDQYIEYLSINKLNHSFEQMLAFYKWWSKLTYYTTTPRYDLLKKHKESVKINKE